MSQELPLSILPPTPFSELAQTLQSVLGECALRAGFVHRFVKRRSQRAKLNGATWVQLLVFGFLNKPTASLQELCQSAANLGINITPQALDQRFSQAAVELLESVLYSATQAVVQGVNAPTELLNRFTAVWVCDSSTVALPAWWAERFPGCGGGSGSGGGSGGGEAALKLHLRADLKCGAWQGPLLTPGREGDQATPLLYQELEAGSLHIADLGFFNLQQFARWNQAGVYWLSRVRVGTGVWHGAECLDLGSWLERWSLDAGEKVSQFERQVELGAARVPCRLFAWRLPPRVAAQRRKRLRAEAKSKGVKLSAQRVELAGWTLLVSNAPASLMSGAEALVLYRARWQIELLFKVWKSVGEIDGGAGFRSQNPHRILCEIYAKLIGQIVAHWVILSSGAWKHEARSLHQMVQAVQKQCLRLASGLGLFGSLQRLTEDIELISFSLNCGCRIQKRKKKPSLKQLFDDPFLPCYD